MEQRVDYSDVEQGTEEWRQARVGKITASNVGAILGHNPYKSVNAVLKSMVQEACGHFKNLDHVPAIRYGNQHEATAAGWYAMEECATLEVSPTGFHVLDDWLGASPDRLVGDHGLLEIKCPHSQALEAEPEFDSVHVQEHYYDQIQLQMVVTGRQWTDFYQWSPNGTMCERVMLDREWLPKYEAKLRDFYEQFVEAMKDPAEWLDDDQLLPEFDEPAMEMLAKEYGELKPLYDEIKPRFEKVEKAIKANVKKASQGYGICVRLTEAAGAIDYKQIVEDRLPDLTDDELEEYRKATSVRKSIRFIE